MGTGQFDADKIQRWSSAITAQIGRMQNREQMVDNDMQVCDLQNFIITQMKARQQEPVEDMISDIVNATLEAGSKLEFVETVREEKRRVGKEGVSPCRLRGSAE